MLLLLQLLRVLLLRVCWLYGCCFCCCSRLPNPHFPQVEINSDSDDDDEDEQQQAAHARAFDKRTHSVLAAATTAHHSKHYSPCASPAPLVQRTNVETGPRKPGGPIDAHIDLAAMLSDDEEVDDDYPPHAANASSLRGYGCACAATARTDDGACDGTAAGGGRYGSNYGGGSDAHGALPDEASVAGSCWQRNAGAGDDAADERGYGDEGNRRRGGGGRGGGRYAQEDGDMPWLSAIPDLAYNDP